MQKEIEESGARCSSFFNCHNLSQKLDSIALLVIDTEKLHNINVCSLSQVTSKTLASTGAVTALDKDNIAKLGRWAQAVRRRSRSGDWSTYRGLDVYLSIQSPSSAEPDHCIGQMDGAKEVTSRFVLACRDGAELLETREEIVDQLAALVQVPVKAARRTRGAP